MSRAASRPIGLVTEESVIEGGEHVGELPALNSTEPKFSLNALSLRMFPTPKIFCQRRVEGRCLLVEQFDLVVKLVVEVLGLAAVSFPRHRRCGVVRPPTHCTKLTQGRTRDAAVNVFVTRRRRRTIRPAR